MAPTQLVLVFEVAIGSAVLAAASRVFGVIYGSFAAYVSFVLSNGEWPPMLGISVLAILPAAYFQVATDYAKTGAVAIVTMTTISIAAGDGIMSAYDVFRTRLLTFIVAGAASVLVELGAARVWARDRLVRSLSSTLRHIQGMHEALAVGIDEPENSNLRLHRPVHRFNRHRQKAQNALRAAEIFLPFCSQESWGTEDFKVLAPIYTEIIYVLHQVINRMDNVVRLRVAYGSSVLEDLNSQVFSYRRHVAFITRLMLSSVHKTLKQGIPMPDHIPSARLAQLRLIERVRDIVAPQILLESSSTVSSTNLAEIPPQVNDRMARIFAKYNFVSWNAGAAGRLEIIEYLEELVELIDLLVKVKDAGKNDPDKPTFEDYALEFEAIRASMDRVRSARIPASTVYREQGTEGFTRALDVSMQLERFRAQIRMAESAEAANRAHAGENEAEAPVSLQKVSTRMWHENAARRRSLNLGDA
ncbi:hypothetical protein PT974_00901 [Cladobotryum mycophilum]|uniref:Uncharacterized protein n=1 Tax=Cladobotryum mycophilum TaxID=491253 RepID=A0ABR0T314_9HYPO